MGFLSFEFFKKEMTTVLKGFLDGYSVINVNGDPIGYVASCLLDVEEGTITHVNMNVHDRSVLLPFRNCIIYHRHKRIKLGISHT